MKALHEIRWVLRTALFEQSMKQDLTDPLLDLKATLDSFERLEQRQDYETVLRIWSDIKAKYMCAWCFKAIRNMIGVCFITLLCVILFSMQGWREISEPLMAITIGILAPLAFIIAQAIKIHENYTVVNHRVLEEYAELSVEDQEAWRDVIRRLISRRSASVNKKTV